MSEVGDDTSLAPIVRQILAAAVRKKLSQAQLARRAKITPETLSRMKRLGRGEFETVARLADAAGLELVVRPVNDYADRLAAGLLG